MAVFLTRQAGKEFLDLKMRGVYATPGDSELVLYTTPPTEAGDDGTEISPYTPPSITVGAAVNGTTGRTAQNTNTNGLLVADMPVDFDQINGYGYRTIGEDDPWLVNDSWTPTDTSKVAGDNLYIPPGGLTTFTKKS